MSNNTRPRALALANVLRGSSPDPRSLNPFYDEARRLLLMIIQQ